MRLLNVHLLVVLLKVRLIFLQFFFAFLDDLGNFKHFEPYLFFVKKLVALSKVRLIDIALLNRLIAEVQPLKIPWCGKFENQNFQLLSKQA